METLLLIQQVIFGILIHTDFKGIQPDNLDKQLIGKSAEPQIKINGYIGGIKIVHGTDVDKMISPDLNESQAPTVEEISEKQQQAATPMMLGHDNIIQYNTFIIFY
jgi:hypothetical protein